LLVRFSESQRETLLKTSKRRKSERLSIRLRCIYKRQGSCGDQVKILESSNLKAMLIRRRPDQETAQEVPYSIFQDCGDAFRNLSLSGVSRVEAARIGEAGISIGSQFKESLLRTGRSILTLMPRRNAKKLDVFTIVPTGG